MEFRNSSVTRRRGRTDVVFASWAVSVGGAERVLQMLIGGVSQNLTSRLIGVSREVGDYLVRDACGRVDLSIVPPGNFRWRSVFSCVRVIYELRPKVVHVNLPGYLDAFPFQVALMFYWRCKVVVHEHLPAKQVRFSHLLIKRFLLWRANAEVAVSDASAQDICQGLGVPASAVQVVRNGIHCGPIAPSGRPLDSRPKLVCIGRFEHQKGFDLAIEALIHLPDCSLTIVGARSAAERAAIVELAGRLGVVARVAVMPWVQDVTEVFASHDVFLMPSRHEAAPLILLEAVAAGISVVASDAGNSREVLGRFSPESLVPRLDAPGIASTVRRVVELRKVDQAALSAGRELVRREFSAAGMVEGWRNLYARLGVPR